MRALLATLVAFAVAACVIRERVKVEYREAPPKAIERFYLIPAVPMAPETEEPEEKKPGGMTA